jgi:hypothetical protein
MALIRGTQSLFPCPICLVPNDKQSDLSGTHMLRTAEQTIAHLNVANELPRAADRNTYLQGYGLRDVEVRLFAYTQVCLMFV